MPTDYRYKKKSPKNKFWNLSIWNKLNQTMVRQCDLRWNQIEASVLRMYDKMVDLGFAHKDGVIKESEGNS